MATYLSVHYSSCGGDPFIYDKSDKWLLVVKEAPILAWQAGNYVELAAIQFLRYKCTATRSYC